MITQKLKKYNFSACSFFDRPNSLKGGFIIRFKLSSPVTEREVTEIFSVPDAVRGMVRLLTLKEAGEGWGWNENYTSYPDENGFVPVLECEIYLNVPYHPERTAMKIGVPLTLYDANDKDMYLLYDGMHLCLFSDGLLINENFPIGEIKNSSDAPEVKIGGKTESIAFSHDLSAVTTSDYERKLDKGIRYYSPAGHCTWAGDVVNFWYDGVYHLIYFFDRHHHGNRFGGGAHFFQQLTTTDFINWTDHGPIFVLEKPWQSVGTGTMFHWKNKYYFAYGFHTSRNIPDEHLYGRDIYEQYRENGYTKAVSYDEIYNAGKYPNGANLAVSDDGIHFKMMDKMFHWEENPSVYSFDNESLMMCIGNGIWNADSPLGEWKLTNPGFPPCGERSSMRNSSECPSFFSKNGYNYIIMGLTGFWRTEKDGETYIDCAAEGHDIYDGLLVPMAVNCDGRLIMAGWLNGIGWGSVIVHRELIQHEDGSLGMRWLPEDRIIKKSSVEVVNNHAKTSPKQSYYWEIDVDPAENGAVEVTFGDNCTLRIDSALREVQISDVGSGRIPPIHEKIHEYPPEQMNPWTLTDTHVETQNFSIANVDCVKKPYTVRIIQHFEEKMNAFLIDAEIGGERTIISNRVGARIGEVKAETSGGAKITRMDGSVI